MATRVARQTQGGTPGRRANIQSNQYFDVGRVGRKTGVTLKDTGIRDDYGLEPLSDIFSTPGSVAQSTYLEEADDGDGSADMVGLSSPGQDVSDVIRKRRATGRATPQAQTANIGRSSIARPDTNRRLQFDDNVRNSIEKQSPFKPKHVLRRSNVGRPVQGRASTNGIGRYQSSSPGAGPSRRSQPVPIEYEYQSSLDGELFDEDNPLGYSTREEVDDALEDAGALVHSSPLTPRKRRISSEQLSSGARADNRRQTLPRPSIGNKRPRLSAPEDEDTHTLASVAAPSSRKLEKAPMYDAPTYEAPQYGDVSAYDEPQYGDAHQNDDAPQYDEGPQYDNAQYDDTPQHDEPLFIDDDDDNDADDFDDDMDAEGSVDLPIVAEVPDDDQESEPQSASPEPVRHHGRGKHKKTKQPAPQRPRAKAVSQRRRSRRDDDEEEEEEDDDDESDFSDVYESDGSNYRAKRGTVSNMRYRSTTPFEDAQKTTRSGRAVMKPLDWWAGEAVIWKNGEVDGVIRANSVEPEKRATHKKRAQHKKKTEKIRNGLGAIDELDEEMLPDDWEHETGVLQGEIAMWDPVLKLGNDEELVTEDLAYAASSIKTRSVEGQSFNYAKIQTLPFFGSGIVEIPPDGIKSTKNAKRMQMNFFVHKGKVEVQITTPILLREEPLRETSFVITEGGAWIVPRGNNYTVWNASSTTTALLFFSQGCEMDAAEADEIAKTVPGED